MLWKAVTVIFLQVFVGFTICTEPDPKSKIIDLLSGITIRSKDVIFGAVGKVRDLLPDTDMLYPDDTAIYELFEYLKVKMKDPYPALDIPVLDPYVTDQLSGIIENDIIGNISMQLQRVNITRASEFTLDNVKMNWLQRQLHLNITLPIICGYATYNISGLLGNMIPLHGTGPMRVSTKNLSAVVTVNMGANKNTIVQIKSIILDYSLEKIELNMTNLMGGGRFGELLNKVLSEEGPRILDLVKTDLIDFSQKWLRDSGNEVLSRTNVTVKSILDFLKVFSKSKVKFILSLNPFKSEL